MTAESTLNTTLSRTVSESNVYRGRFAPSPSGPLHFGSLVTAVGSYLRAKTQQGKWFLRIDDIDPPRQDPAAIGLIQSCLEAHALYWDDAVYFQSQQSDAYQVTLEQLQSAGRSYYCQCTRKQIHAAGGVYQGTCRTANLHPDDVAGEAGTPYSHGKYSLRFLNPIHSRVSFVDKLMGLVTFPSDVSGEDFIIKRKDGLVAYHLASVVDDINMQITEVVRGADLMLPSACQLALFEALQSETPDLMHLPIAVFSEGHKLSKQGHAKALDDSQASRNLYLALAFLGLPVHAALMHDTPLNILDWGMQNWREDMLYSKAERKMATFLSDHNIQDFAY